MAGSLLTRTTNPFAQTGADVRNFWDEVAPPPVAAGPKTAEDAARAQGYDVQGDKAVGTLGRWKTTTPLSAFTPPVKTGPNTQDLYKALSTDTANQQDAANRQFDRNSQQISGVQDFIGGIKQNVVGGTTANTQPVLDQAKKITDLADKQAPGVQKQVDLSNRDVQAAYAKSDRAVSEYKGAIAEFKNTSAQDAAVAAAAIRRSSGAAMQQAQSGINPDGTLMTDAQRADSMSQIQRGTAEQVESAVTPMLSRFNEALVGLKGNLANLEMSGANLRIAGSGQELQGGHLLNEANAQQQRAYEVSASLNQAVAQMRNASIIQSVQLEMDGRFNAAKLVQENPETVVSLFNGLVAMYSLQSAQGANAGAGGRGRSGLPTGEGGRQQVGFAGAGIGGPAAWPGGNTWGASPSGGENTGSGSFVGPQQPPGYGEQPGPPAPDDGGGG